MTDLLEPTAIVGNASLFHADCRDVLRGLPDNSIDSVVTDPPYALVSIQKRFGKPGSAPVKIDDPEKSGCIKAAYQRASAGFMGKSWDTGEVAFSEEFWAEVLRVLKPGGHVVAFSGTRTYHRMAVAIEDAGFEIRDRIRFEQSFDTKYGPLLDSMNDEQRGALLELLNDYCDGGSELAWEYGSGFPKSHNQHGDWEGWGTALKPAWEPIALARKPLCGTVAANLAEWGVGALNVDGCRVGWPDGKVPEIGTPEWGGPNKKSTAVPGQDGETVGRSGPSQLGRWPANIVHDGSDEVLACFPTSRDGVAVKKNLDGRTYNAHQEWGMKAKAGVDVGFGGEGSAARFFYCAKASRKDRDEGLENLPKRSKAHIASKDGGGGGWAKDAAKNPNLPRANTHPTVKPTDLMRWLCRLVTPPGGTILDPFMGSGSTGKAALLEGFRFIGCEREDEYMPIAQARIAAALRPVAKPTKPANDNVPQQRQQADLFASTTREAA